MWIFSMCMGGVGIDRNAAFLFCFRKSTDIVRSTVGTAHRAHRGRSASPSRHMGASPWDYLLQGVVIQNQFEMCRFLGQLVDK